MRRWVPVMAVLLGLGTAAGLFFSKGEATDDPKLFSNRVWAERMPTNDRDQVLYFVPLEKGSKRSGVVERASRFAFGGQVFLWSRDKTKLALEFPQNRQKSQLDVRTWACGSNEAPKGFELCLEFSDGKQKQRLFSKKSWRVSPKGSDLPVAVASEPVDLSDLGACVDCVDVGLEALAPR